MQKLAFLFSDTVLWTGKGPRHRQEKPAVIPAVLSLSSCRWGRGSIFSDPSQIKQDGFPLTAGGNDGTRMHRNNHVHRTWASQDSVWQIESKFLHPSQDDTVLDLFVLPAESFVVVKPGAGIQKSQPSPGFPSPPFSRGQALSEDKIHGTLDLEGTSITKSWRRVRHPRSC